MYFILQYDMKDNTEINNLKDWTLISQENKTYTGTGKEELFKHLKEGDFVYDEKLALTKYLLGKDIWTFEKKGYINGTVRRLNINNITFINAHDLCDNLSTETLDKLIIENDGEYPKSQAHMVCKELDKLKYPDYKCWMNNKAYDLYKGLDSGPMLGVNNLTLGSDLIVNSWDIKSSFPFLMYVCDFPFQFINVIHNTTIETLIPSALWVAEMTFKYIRKKETTVIDWLKEDVITNLRGTFTSIDYTMLREDYDFEIDTIPQAALHKGAKLDKKIRNFIFDNYKIKETKKGTPEYDRAKRNVNIVYGLFYITPQKQENVFRSMTKEKRRPSVIGYWVESYGRYALWKAMKINPESVVYWNTDGFVTTADITEEMQELNKIRKIKGTQLGQWVNEKKDVDCRVFGLSQIWIDGDLKAAGVNRDGVNRYLKDNDVEPYLGMEIPSEYTGNWSYNEETNSIEKHTYTLGGNIQ